MKEIKLWQVYRHRDSFADSSASRRIVYLNETSAVLERNDKSMFVQSLNNIIDHYELISDPDQPWLPLPNGYRLVTDDEMVKYDRPSKYQFYSSGMGVWMPNDKTTDTEWEGYKYAVPIEHVWEEPFEWQELVATGGNLYKAVRQLQQEVQKLKEMHL